MVRLLSFFLPLGLVLAEPMLAARGNDASTKKLVVGAPGQILGYDYDGKTFKNTANTSIAGTTASWMIFNGPDRLYAVDENSNNTRLFNYSPGNSSLSKKPVSVGKGSAGVVSLAFNIYKTHMVGTSYSLGQVDIWELSPSDGSLKLLKQIPLPGPTGPEGVHRAHQAVADPTGRFFAIADLGGDAIHILDTIDWKISSSNSVKPSGVGPRHGAFIGGDSSRLPKYYVVACELKSKVILYEIEDKDSKISLTNPQTLNTYGDDSKPSNTTSAAAGELIASKNERDIYISNRLTGDKTDNIAHFQIKDGKISFVKQVSSDGLNPRHLSFDSKEELVFCANQDGDNGLVAFKRSKDGSLEKENTLAISKISEEKDFGPQFVQEFTD